MEGVAVTPMKRRWMPRALRDAIAALHDDERGDVPGWVLVTLMTAGLVVVTRTV